MREGGIMDKVFSLAKKNSEKYDSSRWGLTLGVLARAFDS